MSVLDSIILGIVEGLTEFLPVSSTGHLILASELLSLPSTEFLKSFEIAIQLGAMLAVVALYFRSFLDIEVLKRIVIAFVPTAVIGYFSYQFLKDYLLESIPIVLWSLLCGGIVLIVLELFHKERENAQADTKSISYAQAFFIGLFQALAIIPGVSRSGATIVGGLLINVSRVAIVEFSFLLAVPTIAAATGYDLLKSGAAFSESDYGLLAIGFFVSLVVAMLSIKLLLKFVRTHSFISFGVYRILVALLFFALVT